MKTAATGCVLLEDGPFVAADGHLGCGRLYWAAIGRAIEPFYLSAEDRTPSGCRVLL